MDGSGMIIDTGVFIQLLRAGIKGRTVLYQLPHDQQLYVLAVAVYEFFMGAANPEKKRNAVVLLNR